MRKNNCVCNLVENYIKRYEDNGVDYDYALTFFTELINAANKEKLLLPDEIHHKIVVISLRLSTLDYYREELIDDVYYLCQEINEKFCKIRDYVKYWLRMTDFARKAFESSIFYERGDD